MNVDWILGFIIFIIFTTWAIGFYFSIYTAGVMNELKVSALHIKDDILSFLTSNMYEIPVRYNSTLSETNAVLYIYYSWPFGKNSTKVLHNSSSLPCMFIGNTLYWQTDISPGMNYFRIEFVEEDTDLNCNSTFDISTANKTIPWSLETKEVFLQEKIDNMTSMNYSKFKSLLGINRNFRIEMQINGNETVYGLRLPPASNVFVNTASGIIYETGKSINLKIMVW